MSGSARVAVGASVLILISVWALAAAEKVTPVPGSGQFFGEAVRSALQGNWAYRDSIWPSKAELEKALDRSAVPPAVREEAVEWVQTMLRKDLVPADLAERFIAITRRVPSIPPDDVDYLIVRYQIGDCQVQIQENGVALSILVNPLETTVVSDVEGYIRSAAEKFLKLPAGVAANAELNLKSVDLRGGGRLYSGTMDYEYEPLMKNRAWWNHSYVWSDGKLFYYRAIERTGLEPPGRPQVHPGIRPRFIR